jgi:nucleoside-diphosphate-sugar epimerase
MPGTVLVAGATGYLGSHIVNCLLSKGYTVRATCRAATEVKTQWMKSICPEAQDRLDIRELVLTTEGASDETWDGLCEGTQGAFFCAGYETQAPETIDFMVNGALGLVRGAKRQGVGVVVLTSSGGSTNPAGLAAGTPKNEILHWSDADAQVAAGKFSPAAKTLMEIKSLLEVGRDQRNEIVDQELADASPRLCIMNPNLILGPQFSPPPVTGNSLPWMAKILRGERMNEKIPNDSMSIIDVRDLALLHVACLEQPTASGRYFGVQRSWPWEEILSSFSEAYPAYNIPPRFEGESLPETSFDHTRMNSLGVQLRPLSETVRDLVAFLKSYGELKDEPADAGNKL